MTITIQLLIYYTDDSEVEVLKLFRCDESSMPDISKTNKHLHTSVMHFSSI